MVNPKFEVVRGNCSNCVHLVDPDKMDGVDRMEMSFGDTSILWCACGTIIMITKGEDDNVLYNPAHYRDHP
jgi:hydroxyethylthiazole kinase-like sugar kinase family protein